MLTPRPWLAPAGRSAPLALHVAAIAGATFAAGAAGDLARPLALATLAATGAAIVAGAIERVAPSIATRLRLAPAAIAVAPILAVAAAASLRAGVVELRAGVGALSAPASGAPPVLVAGGVGTLLGGALLLACRPRAAAVLSALGLLAALLASGLAAAGARSIGLPAREDYLAALPVSGTLAPSPCDGADREDRAAAGLVEIRRVCPHASCSSDPGCYLLVRDRAAAGGGAGARAASEASGEAGAPTWSPPDEDRLFVPGIVASDRIAIRRDAARGLVVVESRAGRWAMAEHLDASDETGGVHAALDERTSVPPAWAACAAAGALAALGWLWRALVTRARLERAAEGHLGEDGWITFDDARPPLHAPSATGGRGRPPPPPGPVVVLFDAGGGGAPYRDRRTPGPRIVPGTFADLRAEARALAADRAVGALAVALVAAAPLAGAFALR